MINTKEILEYSNEWLTFKNKAPATLGEFGNSELTYEFRPIEPRSSIVGFAISIGTYYYSIIISPKIGFGNVIYNKFASLKLNNLKKHIYTRQYYCEERVVISASMLNIDEVINYCRIISTKINPINRELLFNIHYDLPAPGKESCYLDRLDQIIWQPPSNCKYYNSFVYIKDYYLRNYNQYLQSLVPLNYDLPKYSLFSPYISGELTLLQRAVIADDINKVRSLLASGTKLEIMFFSLNILNQVKFHNLYFESKSAKMLDLLLAHSYSVELFDLLDSTENLQKIYPVLFGAIETKNIDIVKVILKYVKIADMIWSNKGISPLVYAMNYAIDQINDTSRLYTLHEVAKSLCMVPEFGNYNDVPQEIKTMFYEINYKTARLNRVKLQLPRLSQSATLTHNNLKIVTKFGDYVSEIKSTRDLTISELRQLWSILKINFKSGKSSLQQIFSEKFINSRNDKSYIELFKLGDKIVSAFAFRLMTEDTHNFGTLNIFYGKLAAVLPGYGRLGFANLTFRIAYAWRILNNKPTFIYNKLLQPGYSYRVLPTSELYFYPKARTFSDTKLNNQKIVEDLINTITLLNKDSPVKEGITSTNYLVAREIKSGCKLIGEYYDVVPRTNKFNAMATLIPVNSHSESVFFRNCYQFNNYKTAELYSFAQILNLFLLRQTQAPQDHPDISFLKERQKSYL